MDNTSGSNKHLYSGVISDFMSNVPVAYIRPVASGNSIVYAVCTGDGSQLATFNTQEAAFYAARQHDLEPTLVH